MASHKCFFYAIPIDVFVITLSLFVTILCTRACDVIRMDGTRGMSFERDVSAEQILSYLTQSMHHDPTIREPAEAYLSSIETNIVPGYLGTLVEIARMSESVTEVRAFESWWQQTGDPTDDSTILCRIFDYWL